MHDPGRLEAPSEPLLIAGSDGPYELYTATHKPEEVQKWRAERARYENPAGSSSVQKK